MQWVEAGERLCRTPVQPDRFPTRAIASHGNPYRTRDRRRRRVARAADPQLRCRQDAREQRAPLYDSLCARLAQGTAARRLGISIDIVAPGMRSCPTTTTWRRRRRS